nr:PAS domain S-box protein [Azospirillum sp. SYSU D00513]
MKVEPPATGLRALPGERRFQLLIDSIHDYAIYMLDPQGIVSSWNTGAQRFKGYGADEIIGQHFSRFFTPEDRKAGLPQRALAVALADGRFETEGWRVRKDGTRFWASAVIDTIRDEDGALVGFAKITRDNTEKRKAEEALRLSEQRFRLLVQGVTDYAIYMLDPNGIVSSWNAGAQRFKGYSEDEIIGQHFSRFYPEEDRANGLPQRGLATALAEGRFETEGWRLRKDGTRFWASVVIDPIRDETGRLVGYAKVTRDNTEKRKAEEALRQSEERFRLLVQGVTDYAIYMLDPNGNVVNWNAGAQRFKGYREDEIVGQHFSRFYPEEDRANGLPQRGLATALADGRFETEGWRLRKDGTRFWASVVIDPIRDEKGELIGYAKVTRDITDKKAAQEELSRSEQRFRLLVQGVTDYAIYLLDPEGRITNWNAGAERMKGYGADEITGQHFSLFYTEEDRTGGLPQRGLKTAAREGKFETEGWRVRKDGSRFWASVVIDPIRDDGGELVGFAKVTRDITEWRQTQQALEEAREALFQSQKMEAVGQLTGGVAHDFNNLLQAISGSLEVIERRLAAGRTDVQQYANAARNALDRASALTQRLLAFSRRQPLKPERTDLNALVTGMRDLIERSVGEAVRVEMDLPEDICPTWADAHQIENALLNLSINARDAMPEGGRLTISTANTQLDEEEVATDPGLAPGDYVTLSVTDTGTGMPPDVLERAFEPFFTTKPIGQGTGLGLSQLYGFARQSGGRVRMESEVGKGTTVRLYLPCYVEAEDADTGSTSATAAAAAEPPRRAACQAKVLVVEDESLIRMLLVDALEEQGYTVLEAEDGNGAMQALDANGGIGLLVTDVGLPGINGRQLAEMARSRHPELKVLFLTGYAYNAAMEKEVLGENTQLLAKPVAIDTFLDTVAAMVDGG